MWLGYERITTFERSNREIFPRTLRKIYEIMCFCMQIRVYIFINMKVLESMRVCGYERIRKYSGVKSMWKKCLWIREIVYRILKKTKI